MKKVSTKEVVGEKGFTCIRSDAAGIDVGSKRHYVALPPGIDKEPVKSFGCFTPELHEMAKWLKENGITTVAMESTGVYWIPIFQVLEEYGIETILTDASHISNVSGRKSDVQDCQWIQQLHACGLLRGAFRPDRGMVVLRSYWRQRSSLVQSCSRTIHIMQKSLEQMNMQFHKAISDITGVTGMQIIRAIVAGERDPKVLANMRQPGVKSSIETIVKSLSGQWRQEHLFTLRQALEAYDFYQKQIEDCDANIEAYIATFETKSTEKVKRAAYRRKNQPNFDMQTELCRMCGVDLTKISGISAMTAMTVISEYGIDLSKFPTENHFTSHLGLSPNNKITGGKVMKRRTRRIKSRSAKALRLAAQSLHRSSAAMGAYFRRMKGRHGAAKAITATARKLAILIYRMLRYGEDYVEKGQAHYEQKYREQQERYLQKQAKKFGYQLVSIQAA